MSVWQSVFLSSFSANIKNFNVRRERENICVSVDSITRNVIPLLTKLSFLSGLNAKLKNRI